MAVRSRKKAPGAFDFLCLCIALRDSEVSEEAWDALSDLSAHDAEQILLTLPSDGDGEPALEAAQCFLKSKSWGGQE